MSTLGGRANQFKTVPFSRTALRRTRPVGYVYIVTIKAGVITESLPELLKRIGPGFPVSLALS